MTSDSFFAFLNGLVSGSYLLIFIGNSQVLVMQPFEIIKVRLQTQSNTNKVYNGIVDCFTKIVKN
jgi:hypothetical protein